MKLNKIFENSIRKFEERVLPEEYLPRSTLLSELFFICAFAEHIGSNLIIDSGTSLGRSAEVFAKYGFQLIITLDINIRSSAYKRLRKHNNVAMIQGNDHDVIPKILSTYNKNSNVCLFLDSTKNESACRFAKELQENYSCIKMISLHDQWKHHKMKRYFAKTIFSDEETFFSKYWYLSSADINNSEFQKRYLESISRQYINVSLNHFKGFVAGVTKCN